MIRFYLRQQGPESSDPSDSDEPRTSRYLDFVNRRHSPAAVFKLLHPLHHLRDASFFGVYLSHTLNPAILRVLDECTSGSLNRYLLHTSAYLLEPSTLDLKHLLPRRENRKWEGVRKRKAVDDDLRFVRSRGISLVVDTENVADVRWLLSNGGAYGTAIIILLEGAAIPWREVIDDVSWLAPTFYSCFPLLKIRFSS